MGVLVTSVIRQQNVIYLMSTACSLDIKKIPINSNLCPSFQGETDPGRDILIFQALHHLSISRDQTIYGDVRDATNDSILLKLGKHYPCSCNFTGRVAVNTSAPHGCHFGQSCSQAVFRGTGQCTLYPRTQPVNTGTEHPRPRAVYWQKHCTTMLFVNTARRHGYLVHTTRVHGP